MSIRPDRYHAANNLSPEMQACAFFRIAAIRAGPHQAGDLSLNTLHEFTSLTGLLLIARRRGLPSDIRDARTGDQVFLHKLVSGVVDMRPIR